MKKSFEKEIVQTLNNMVKAGLVLANRLINGETRYSLSEKALVKAKPVSAEPAGNQTKVSRKKVQSEAAKKAWVTRRKNDKVKAVRKAAACKAVKTKAKNKITKAKLSKAAYKAWDTRRSLAENPLLRGKFSK